MLDLGAEAGSRPGGRGTCSLLRQRKVPKRKATPSLRPLRCAKGQTCVGAVAGCAVELALRCARRSDNHGESVHEACALRRACSPRNRPAAGAASRGGQPDIQQPNSHTGRRCARPGFRSARRLRPRRRGRAQRWPVWMSAPRVPFRMRRGAQGRGRVRVPQDTRTSCSDSPQLFERSCEAAQ